MVKPTQILVNITIPIIFNTNILDLLEILLIKEGGV